MSKFKIFKQFWNFARMNKKFWLFPMVIILFLFGMLMIFAEGSAFAPFIYTIF